MKEKIFSGVQPSGMPTIGNYIGAMQHFVSLQDTYDATYCVVNQHAITVRQDPKKLREMTRQLAALYIAMGLDPDKARIFVQSDVAAHAQAAWLVQCHSGLGELERMTQFKDKAAKQEAIPFGLLAYPTLMVADIILYDAKYVPVGDDQRQHLELTRDFVDRFNSAYGNILVKPEGLFPKEGARIMSLQDPSRKMSKSDANERASVYLTDKPKAIIKKIKGAITDSIGEVHYDQEKQPAISNLLEMYSSLTHRSIDSIVSDYEGRGYGDFKGDLADIVVDTLQPIQERYEALVNSSVLDDILEAGAASARLQADQVLARMEEAIGFNYRL